MDSTEIVKIIEITESPEPKLNNVAELTNYFGEIKQEDGTTVTIQ